VSTTASPRSEVRLGVRESIPLGFALVPIGLAFGYGAHVVGLSWWLAALMSTFVYGGPSQFIATGLISVGASVPTIVATTFVANLRYALFAASLAPFLGDAPRAKLLWLCQGLADGSYALTLQHAQEHPETPRKERYLQGSFYVSFGAWVSSSIAGALIGSALPEFLAYGLGFATPAIFIAFLVPYVRDARAVMVMLVAGIGTVLGNEHLPTGTGTLVAIVLAVALGGLLPWRRRPR
jgi:4-azaleucine resistance transporter AzlC